MLLGQQREPYRDIFFAVWEKYQRDDPTLAPMEKMIGLFIDQHPEYHEIFSNPAQFADAEFPANNLYKNPFLHISMHLSLFEHIQLDRPEGILALYQKLLIQLPDEHQLQHQIMDIMASQMWDAIHHGQPFDDIKFLSAVKKLTSN